MNAEFLKIKIDEQKKNIIIIGNSFDLLDIVEIFLYKSYNVITAIDEFDGMQKIKHFNPICVFVKTNDNISPVLAFMDKNMIVKNFGIPVIAFTKDKIMAINELALKNSGIREIIKFPINQQDFLAVIQPIINIIK